jgi:hypothetical protein
MFADIVLLTKLESFAFPLTTITKADNAGGNTGATWNYGASDTNDFGAGIEDGKADHTWAGVYGVTDSAYDSNAGGNIALCTGTAGASCSG